MSNYIIEQLDAIDPVKCPCGSTRRGFIDPDNPTVSQHLVEIAADSRTHYHKKITETYFVLEGQGQMELDGELFDIKPGMGVLHDPDDEWFD